MRSEVLLVHLVTLGCCRCWPPRFEDCKALEGQQELDQVQLLLGAVRLQVVQAQVMLQTLCSSSHQVPNLGYTRDLGH